MNRPHVLSVSEILYLPSCCDLKVVLKLRIFRLGQTAQSEDRLVVSGKAEWKWKAKRWVSDCRMSYCRLSDCRLSDCRLSDCRLSDCKAVQVLGVFAKLRKAIASFIMSVSPFA